MTVIRWEDPPAHGNTGQRRVRPLMYQDVADTLRSKPGRWGVVVEDMPTSSCGALSHRIRAGQGPWAPKGTFESRCVGPTGGKGAVYARYVGGAS